MPAYLGGIGTSGLITQQQSGLALDDATLGAALTPQGV